ncbi:hypothetical protein GUJ93_ZPchr0003g16897 [Zizania palustris]|uniref:Uncharacterized protein n=1 Tax=Zizania palustris TaxID=103762 RepID=A0A8J5SG49_ZIZPA|nr:hypothetical protein GUJ93_ZPchr0003g16897 [Zizania palustris]
MDGSCGEGAVRPTDGSCGEGRCGRRRPRVGGRRWLRLGKGSDWRGSRRRMGALGRGQWGRQQPATERSVMVGPTTTGDGRGDGGGAVPG